ncbi:MAG: SRPBCC family protein [Crocinitomicaceae bacterium]|nr:SRPBCC family protein [Crocinitomicaceae bacterium]
MPKIHIDKSIVIKATPEELYSKLRDFHNWTVWSPWLITEPEAKVSVNEDGKYFEWEGKYVGSGNMTVLKENENSSIEYDLTFLKPWKSKAKTTFKFVPEEDGTRVHWIMDTSLPFFMFWMKKMMAAWIGMDLERGLSMLKSHTEEGTINSKLEIKGFSQYAGCQYVGLKTTATMDGLGEAMSKDYEKLMPYFMDGRQEHMDGHAFSIYHKWELVKGQVEYTAAVPVKSIPSDLLEGMFVGNVAPMKVHTITHTGTYAHSGNAWGAQMSRSRGQLFKTNKKIHPMEVYPNSPKDTPANELISEVIFSVK